LIVTIIQSLLLLLYLLYYCGYWLLYYINIFTLDRAYFLTTHAYTTQQYTSTIGKIVKLQYLLHMPSQYGELRPTNGRHWLAGLGHPSKLTGFASWLHYCRDVAQWKSTKLCTMFGRLLGWYIIYTSSGAFGPNGILPGANFTLLPSLAFSCFGSVTARHWSSGHMSPIAISP